MVLHVAADGSDSAGDGSSAEPCATIGHAAEQAKPGTTIRVHAGTYTGGSYISGLAGAASALIWIGGAPREQRPLVQGAGRACT